MKQLQIIITVSLFFLLIQSCSNPADMNPPGDQMSGYVTHINDNLIPGGFYSVSLYSADSVNPFNRVPVATDSLNLTLRQNVFETVYSMTGIQSGNYYVAATWSRYPRIQNEVPIVLGIYGCDTSKSCSTYKVIMFPNYEGVFRNILSWTDTTKRLN